MPVLEKGEKFVLPADAPAMPPGIKAVWGMKLVDMGGSKKWMEADEADFRMLLKEAGKSEEFIENSVKAKHSRVSCHFNSSTGYCDGDCNPFPNHECVGFSNTSRTKVICNCTQ